MARARDACPGCCAAAEKREMSLGARARRACGRRSLRSEKGNSRAPSANGAARAARLPTRADERRSPSLTQSQTDRQRDDTGPPSGEKPVPARTAMHAAETGTLSAPSASGHESTNARYCHMCALRV
eukprot:6204403-Pleurochrysis_carterae.AAC.3